MQSYLITWTTYGTWLPGDERQWVSHHEHGIRAPQRGLRRSATDRLTQEPVILNEAQRAITEQTIRDHCDHRMWKLEAINVRSNHVHIVVVADRAPERVMTELKTWCSRRLNENQPRAQASGIQRKWWTRHGSTKWINDESYLANAIRYVNERQ